MVNITLVETDTELTCETWQMDKGSAQTSVGWAWKWAETA